MRSDRRGLLVAIEGGDASGKATQTKFLKKELKRMTGYEVTTFSFPRYDQSLTAILSREITHGHYGNPLLLPPKIAALSFTLDRVIARDDLNEAISRGHVICDRYTPSNLVYQAAKLWGDESIQDEFIAWLEHIEYKECALPEPDLVLFLDVLPRVAKRLMVERGRQLDQHEASEAYQEQVYQTYMRLSEERDNWEVIHCLDKRGQIRPPKDISGEMAEIVQNYYQLLVGEEEGSA
jgi:dTMP kinase